MVNKVILIGRLGRDPEMRYTAGGTPVCNFSMATNEYFKSKTGERQERTEWHKIVAWTRLAEQCQKLLKKGSLAYIEGRLQTRDWNDRDGNKRTTTEVVAMRMQILTPKGEAALDMDAAAAGHGPEPPEDLATEITDEDVPF